jgi:hypothetical protein
VFTLGEEEIADVSLATFYVFDKEGTEAARNGVQIALLARLPARRLSRLPLRLRWMRRRLGRLRVMGCMPLMLI